MVAVVSSKIAQLVQEIQKLKTLSESELSEEFLFFQAIYENDIEKVKNLLEDIPYTIQIDNISTGTFALKLERKEIYDLLLNHGLRSEFILRLTQKITNDGTVTHPSSTLPSNNEYLARTLTYSTDGNTLLDSDCNAVMMSWEDNLMKRHTDYLCPEPCRVLNVGFGLGIIDGFIQSTNPVSHTIIEAHPDVYKKMIDDGWDKKATIIFGRWQDVVDQLGVYDAIFFDTFGEYYDDLDEFHQVMVNILDENGRCSFFNGLCGTDEFYHEIGCEMVKIDLEEMGMVVEFDNIDVVNDMEWGKSKREYWYKYQLILGI